MGTWELSRLSDHPDRRRPHAKQLGERLEVKEQQIQRWEANNCSDVEVECLQEVADALGMEVRKTVNSASTALAG